MIARRQFKLNGFRIGFARTGGTHLPCLGTVDLGDQLGPLPSFVTKSWPADVP
jgi:hypothetical protein